jgi:enoyl-CoA hydratase
MTSHTVTVEVRGFIAVVRLNCREPFSFLSSETIDGLEKTLDEITSDPEIRAVILIDTLDRAPSARIETSESVRIDQVTADDALHRVRELCKKVVRFGVPVIATVGGVVAGTGLDLALACHLRVASSDAALRLTDSGEDWTPTEHGPHGVARIIGSGPAQELILSGRTISAQEALRIGLVNRVVEPDNLMEEAESLAKSISSLAPLAIRACLEAVTVGLTLPLDEGLALEAELFSRLFTTEDVREGTQAFLERRDPIFEGK